MRTAGTVVGLVLASVLVHFVPAGHWYQILLILIFCFGMRLAGPGNVALSAVCLAGLVVVLLALNGFPAHATLLDRSVATLIGGALAIVATLVRPVWERELMADRLADLLAAYRHLPAVDHRADLATGADAAARPGRVAACPHATPRRRSTEPRAEPVSTREEIELGRSVLANSHRLIHGLLTVEAVRPTLLDAGGLSELDELLRLAGLEITAAEDALRTGERPHGSPELRSAQSALVTVLKATPELAGGIESAGALVDASDRIANSLDTIVNELNRSALGAVAR